MLASVRKDVPCTRAFARDEHLIARGNDEQRRGIRLDAARSEAAAASLRDDIRLTRFVRTIVGIDIVRIPLWLDLRRALRRQGRASEVGGEAAKTARSAGIEPHPSALEHASTVCRVALRAER